MKKLMTGIIVAGVMIFMTGAAFANSTNCNCSDKCNCKTTCASDCTCGCKDGKTCTCADNCNCEKECTCSTEKAKKSLFHKKVKCNCAG